MSPRHELIRRINRLRKAAGSANDPEAAAAFEECLLKVTGGNEACPFGALMLAEFLRTETNPGVALEETGESLSVKSADLPRTPERFVEDVIKPIHSEAMASGDEALLNTLRMCELFATGNVQCPIYRLFRDRAKGEQE